jgi:uncharacterized protein YheU (UPF0270 family)
MGSRGHPEGSEPFDVTLPEGFDLGEHESALEAAAEQAGSTVERDGSVIVVPTFGPRTRTMRRGSSRRRWACRWSG